jgi:PKD repeat protein
VKGATPSIGDLTETRTQGTPHMRLARPAPRSMSRPTPARRSTTRASRRLGQSLVEFALVLPLMLGLTVVALDFGRVYLGWINLQNMARIAANFAANNPDGWSGAGNASIKTQYQNQIQNDAKATNCALPSVGGQPTAPSPVFSGTTIGGSVSVSLTCQFGVITPFVKDILGGSVAVSVSSVFPVKSGMIPSSGGTVVGTPPNAAFTGNAALAPASISGVVPFDVVFRDTSGGYPTSWLWDFGDLTAKSAVQDPPTHTYLVAGTYTVTMTATNAWGSTTATMVVSAMPPTAVDFTADKTSGTSPVTVNFTDASTAGGSTYTWDFGSGQGTGSGKNASHQYTVPGSYTVKLTVKYPSGDVANTKTNYITVKAPLCTVPHLDGVKRHDAQSTWNGAGFNGIVVDGPGAPSGNYIITTQSITANSQVPCTTSVMVNRP